MFCKVNRPIMYGIAAAALATTSTAAMADVLVTRSSGSAAREYPRGTRLADDHVLVLRSGDRVTVLRRTGTRVFNGPGRFVASGGRTVASMTLGGSGARSTIRAGVSRGTPEAEEVEPAPVRNVWQVDVEQSGPFCTLAGQSVSLWRNSAAEPADVVITRTSDGESVTVSFTAEQHAHVWPEQFGTDGGGYTISGVGQGAQVAMMRLEVPANDAVAVGAALLENDCGPQLDALAIQSREEVGQEDES